MLRRVAASAAAVLLCAPAGAAQSLRGWLARGDAGEYSAAADRGVKHGGAASVTLRSATRRRDRVAVVFQRVAADAYRGKRVRLSGWARSSAVENWAGLWMRVDQGELRLTFDNMEDRPVLRTTGWRRYQLVLDVPREASDIYFGVLLVGRGQIWADDFELGVVDRSVPKTELLMSLNDPRRHAAETVRLAGASQRLAQPANLGFER